MKERHNVTSRPAVSHDEARRVQTAMVAACVPHCGDLDFNREMASRMRLDFSEVGGERLASSLPAYPQDIAYL